MWFRCGKQSSGLPGLASKSSAHSRGAASSIAQGERYAASPGLRCFLFSITVRRRHGPRPSTRCIRHPTTPTWEQHASWAAVFVRRLDRRPVARANGDKKEKNREPRVRGVPLTLGYRGRRSAAYSRLFRARLGRPLDSSSTSTHTYNATSQQITNDKFESRNGDTMHLDAWRRRLRVSASFFPTVRSGTHLFRRSGGRLRRRPGTGRPPVRPWCGSGRSIRR